MFAGKNFNKDDELLESAGDHIVSIVDLELYHPDYEFWLWDAYTWNAHAVHEDLDDIAWVANNVASSGFGAAANSFMDFVNVEEHFAEFAIAHNLHRSKDPGAGAFTYHHSRTATATRDIAAGEELFSDNKKKAIMEDFWRTMVVENNDVWQSRTLAALPMNQEDYAKVLETGLVTMKQELLTRDVTWLDENGVCADHMYMDESTLPQAGHGAFARRPMTKDSVVLPVPLIHIPDRHLLEMYEYSEEMEEVNRTKATGQQLLLNYCMGHRESTLLLCPYGPIMNGM
ncbi:MAG: hypothetical protein SGARI_000864 [Bacillariaceae sp.]